MEPVAADERRLWEAYRSEGDTEAQQRLFSRYVPWARAVARDVYRRARVPQMDWADYAQNATIGLLEAMGRFDVGRGIDFVAYAKPRVRGAVFNGLRLFLADGRVPDIQNRWRDRTGSFDAPDRDDPLDEVVESVVGLGLGFLLDANAAADQFVSHVDASMDAERQEMDELLAAAVLCLAGRERLVVTLHYHQHMAFVDIAALLGLTKGRISQIHKAALGRLRSHLCRTTQLHLSA